MSLLYRHNEVQKIKKKIISKRLEFKIELNGPESWTFNDWRWIVKKNNNDWTSAQGNTRIFCFCVRVEKTMGKTFAV